MNRLKKKNLILIKLLFSGQGNNEGDELAIARLLVSKFSEEGMIAGDIANYIGEAFKKIKKIS